MLQNKELISQKVLDTVKDLIRFKTVDGKFGEFEKAVNYIENFFDGTGISVEKLYYNKYPALFISTHKTKTPQILLQGHVDVVNGNEEQFVPKTDGEKLYGRGSVDMKGFDAIALHLIRDLFTENNELDLGLMLTFDEEIGSENGAARMVEDGYSCDLLINGDGGYNFAVTHGEKGILKIELKVEASPGRHPYPWQGKNASELLINDYNRITKLFPNHSLATEKDSWHSTYSLYDVNIENEELYPAHKAEAKMNIYFTDDLTIDELLQKINDVTQFVEIKKISGSERVYLDPDNGHVHSLRDIMEQNFNREIVIRTENGSSDARYFTNKGIPIVIVKVVGEDYHGDNEHLDISYITPLYNSLKEFILIESDVNKVSFQEQSNEN